MNCDTVVEHVATKNVIGEGAQGKVYPFDDKVLKIIYGSSNVDLLKRAASIGVAPPIYDVQVCKGFTYYVQKRLEKPFDPTYAHQLPELVTRMIEHGMFHNDLHQNNMMVENGRLYLIDFDMASFVSDYGYKSFDSNVQHHSFWEDLQGDTHPIHFTEGQVLRIRSVRPDLAKTEKERNEERKVEDAKKKARENLQRQIRLRMNTRHTKKGRRRKTRKARS